MNDQERPHQLRGYQTAGIKQIFEGFRTGKKSVLLVVPTGGGKTRIMAEITRIAFLRGKRILEISHRDFLVDQFCDAIELQGMHSGIIQASFPEDFSRSVQVATIQTLYRRIDKIVESWKPDLVMFDECHHLVSKTQLAIFEKFRSLRCWIIGVTATPIRMDGGNIQALFESIIEPIRIKNLIEQGYLVPSRVINKYKVDVSKCRKVAGDYAIDDLERATNTISSNAHVLEEYLRTCKDKQFIGFAVSVQHSRDLCALFNQAGIRSIHIDGTTRKPDREALLNDFRSKKALGLFNCEIATEGFDCPNTEVIIMDRPTASLPLYLQMGGRGMRSAPGKTECVVLDFTENTMNFGKLDLNRRWDIDTKTKTEIDEEIKLKICKQCYQLVLSRVKHCPYCGYVFVSSTRSAPQEFDGKMGEYKDILFEREILEEVAENKGYKAGWVWHLLQDQREGYRIESKYFIEEYLRVREKRENNSKRNS